MCFILFSLFTANVEITFELINNIWKQKKEISKKTCSITGLDGDTGINLLNLLNDDTYLGKYITNKNNQQIYPKIITPTEKKNETKPH